MRRVAALALQHHDRAAVGPLGAGALEDREQLAALNAGLERLVEARSSALSSALAEVQEKEHRLREISAGAVELQEEQQRAIARDLHDSAGQTLTAIRINLQLVGNLLEQAKPEQLERVKQLAARTTALVDETVEEIRRAVRSLGPAVIEDVGLARAVERMCEDVEHRAGVLVEYEIDLGDRKPVPAVETTCYRIVQEALTNVIRHARAGQVKVEIRAGADEIEVVVVDDGVGIGGTTGSGHGIAGMRERASSSKRAATRSSRPTSPPPRSPSIAPRASTAGRSRWSHRPTTATSSRASATPSRTRAGAARRPTRTSPRPVAPRTRAPSSSAARPPSSSSSAATPSAAWRSSAS